MKECCAVGIRDIPFLVSVKVDLTMRRIESMRITVARTVEWIRIIVTI